MLYAVAIVYLSRVEHRASDDRFGSIFDVCIVEDLLDVIHICLEQESTHHTWSLASQFEYAWFEILCGFRR
jgi:hypothetical protein